MTEKTQQLIALAALRDKAEAIGKSSYERLNAEDMVDVIDYIIHHDKKLSYRLKEIIRESRKNMADRILMARQTTINFED